MNNPQIARGKGNSIKVNRPPGKILPQWDSGHIINWLWGIGRLLFKLSWRNAKGFMGRFGGGWNWKLGFQAGGRSLIISLLVMEFSIYIRKKVKMVKE